MCNYSLLISYVYLPPPRGGRDDLGELIGVADPEADGCGEKLGLGTIVGCGDVNGDGETTGPGSVGTVGHS